MIVADLCTRYWGMTGHQLFHTPAIRTPGCFDAKLQNKSGSDDGRRNFAAAGAAAAATVADSQDEGAFGYLGCPPRTPAVRYGMLVEKLPGLLRLVQGGHRLGKAALQATSSAQPQGIFHDRYKVGSSLRPGKTQAGLLMVMCSFVCQAGKQEVKFNGWNRFRWTKAQRFSRTHFC